MLFISPYKNSLNSYFYLLIFLTATLQGCDLNHEKVKNSDLPVLKSEETITLSISGEFDFGSVDVGDSSTQQITLTADDDFEVTNITLPSLNPPFRIDSDSTDCGDSLPKGGSCTITVTFQPFMPENYELNFALRYLNNTHYVNRVYPMTASGISSSTISIEDSWNAGLFPIGLKDDGKLFRIILTGYSPAENFEISGIESPFEYVSGNYPGTNGNCSSSISYSCFIDFTINSDDLVFAKNNLNLSYSISGLPTSTSTVLYGSRAIFLGAETPERIPSLAYGYSKLTSIFSPDGNKLFLIDQNSHRLLIYNSILSQQSLPDIVIGQESDSVILPNKGKTANKSSLKLPQSIFSDGESMVVTDKGNNRILFWEKIPEVNSTPADLEFTGINAPKSAVIFAGKLIAADTVNDRLLFWDIATYNEGDSGTDMGLSTIESPVHISVEGSSLWVVNQGSENSIMKFSDPFNNPNPETTKSFTETPFHMHIGESKIYVTFTNDHIIKVFDSTLNFLVDIGVDSSGSTTQNTLKFPAASIEINQKVYVTDADNHRLMIWNNPPLTSNEAADLQVGQKDFVSSTPHYVAASTNVFRMPFASFYNNNLIISDSGNSRLLKYADNLTSSNIEPSSTSDGFQFGPSTSNNDGTSDYTYVAEWNSATIHYQAIASDQFTPGTTFNAGSNILSVCSNSSFLYVLLDNDNIESYAHGEPPTLQSTIDHPALNNATSIDCNESYVTITNTGDNEVLIWEKNNAAELQDVDLATHTIGTFSSSSLNSPKGASTTSGGVVIISDTGNRRVLIWDDLNNLTEDPPYILGQKNINGSIVSTGIDFLTEPTQISSNGGKTVISDQGANNVIVIGSPPASNP